MKYLEVYDADKLIHFVDPVLDLVFCGIPPPLMKPVEEIEGPPNNVCQNCHEVWRTIRIREGAEWLK